MENETRRGFEEKRPNSLGGVTTWKLTILADAFLTSKWEDVKRSFEPAALTHKGKFQEIALYPDPKDGRLYLVGIEEVGRTIDVSWTKQEIEAMKRRGFSEEQIWDRIYGPSIKRDKS